MSELASRSSLGVLRLLLPVLGLLPMTAGAAAQADPAAVIELRFRPAPRAQIAIWLEDAEGRFLRTVALTEAVAFRGIGNRPGASQMNSGYRWPYGRREGALPIWASRRAAAPGAQRFHRVIFQNRLSEGLASRTSSDQSVDDYYCLSFDRSTTTRDALDAVSCASVFTSDKGRFLVETDLAGGYSEPWEDSASGVGTRIPLALHSLYPPRMDVRYCDATSCFDHADVERFAAHAREVMPEIDAVTMATPPGGVEQSLLFSLPAGWPAGHYVAWLEINVEGDYNATFNDTTYPTPTEPSADWDSWARTYGYAYRGQPSVAYRVPFELSEPGEQTQRAEAPVGRSSWDMWAENYGSLETMSGIADDPNAAQGSGADRLMAGPAGARLTLVAQTLAPLPAPDPDADPWEDLPPLDSTNSTNSSSSGDSGNADSSGGSEPPATDPDAGGAGTGGDGAEVAAEEGEPHGQAPAEGGPAAAGAGGGPGGFVVLPGGQDPDTGPIGAIEGLVLQHHADALHSHQWIRMRFLAARSELALHRYEVRVGTAPIVDERSFIRNGRPAKTATTDAEGAVMLMLPTDVRAGDAIEAEIGDLVASTRYFVAVRGVDRLDRRGPISVAAITTTERSFATVTPCVIASAAYGSPLASEVGVLRRLRDRYLLSHAPGRAAVAAYYANGPWLSARVREHAALGAAVRGLLSPLLALAAWLEGDT